MKRKLIKSGTIQKKEKNYIKIYKTVAIVFFFYTSIVLPLYFEDAYFNMLEAKAHCYTALAAVLFPILLMGLILQVKSGDGKHLFKGMEPLDWAVLIFGVYAIISCLYSPSFYYSFTGTLGWSVGGFVMFSLPVFYQVVSRYLNYRPNLWPPVFAVNLFIFLVAVCHSCRFDVLGLHEGVADYQYFQYLSTIGQINGFATYLCMLVPVIAIFYLASSDRFTCRLLLLVFALAAMSIILCESDGVYLGLGFCAFFAVPYVLGSVERIERFFHLVAVYGAALLIIGILPIFEEKVGRMDTLAGAVLSPKVAVPVFVLGIAGAMLVKKFGSALTEKWRHRIAIALEILMALVVIALVVYNVLSFDDAWGNSRGAIWRMSMELYQEFPLKQKLVGLGPEMLRPYYGDITEYFGVTTLTPHSEPIQALLTMGLIGVASWLGIWVCAFRSYFKNKVWKSHTIGLFLPVAAYFGQSFVNSPRAEEYVIFYLMLSCYQRVLRTEKQI